MEQAFSWQNIEHNLVRESSGFGDPAQPQFHVATELEVTFKLLSAPLAIVTSRVRAIIKAQKLWYAILEAKKRAANEGFVAPAPKRTRATRPERRADVAVAEHPDSQLEPSTVVGEDQYQQSERPTPDNSRCRDGILT